MRRTVRILGTLLAAAGALMLVWAVLVWRWQDPFTLLYTRWQQQHLEQRYEQRLADFSPPAPTAAPAGDSRLRIAEDAKRYRLTLREGDPIGHIRIPRLDVDMILVNGTDTSTLKKGPARYKGTYLPGEGQLIYIAGHRTTYSAPFSQIERLTRGDRVEIEVPYGTFEYAVTRHRIVRADAVQVLKTRGHEEIALQACWPRFFASHRYIAYAKPVRVRPRSGQPYSYTGTELSAAP